ncbi:MAG: hypothetical protein V4592_18460 [Bacteroidota bacterium]
MIHNFNRLFNRASGRRVRLICLLLASGFALKSRAQTATDTNLVKGIVSAVAKYNNTYTSEKLYLHFDKPHYAIGDTAWFKAYVLSGSNHGASTSAKLYVDLLDHAGKKVQQLVIPVFDGLAQGYFPLNEKQLNDGSYTIRAYTNWLQNFGGDYFFYKQLYVSSLGGKAWLLTEQHRRDTGTDSNRVQLAMRFNDAKGLPLVMRQFSIKIQEGTKTILKSEVATTVDGTLNSAFSLPGKANKHNLNILVEDVNDKSQHISFPFYPSGADGDIDLQFLPEGGKLITGLLNRIGFKAIGEDGLSRDIKGVVVDSKNEETATLQATHNGMGSFVLVPQPGETYTAKIMVDGKEKRYPLPTAKTQGMALRVDGINHADELYVYISATAADNKSYTLIAQSGDKVYFGSGFVLNGDGYYNTRIRKSLFPTGVVSIVVLSPDRKPVSRRSVFIDRQDALQISALPSQAAYNPGDSIALNMHVVNGSNAPAQGSFAVSVTDDTQVKDAVQADNIQSHILLVSELKGNIENPAWYFTNGEEKLKEKALDNLLLAQGWQGFDWEKVDAPIPVAAYQPETDISITGNVKGLFKKSDAGVKVSVLANGNHPFLQDTISDINGRFAFHNLPLTDTVAYLLKLHNVKDRAVAAEIIVDEFKPTTAALTDLPRRMPWNMNADTALISYINKASQRSQQNVVFAPSVAGKLLKQVDIKARREATDVGNELALEIASISEEELIAAKKMSLMDLIYKKFPLFKESSIYAINVSSRTRMWPEMQFVNGTQWMVDIVADGQFVARGQYALSMHDRYLYQKEYLNTLGADDVKSISLSRGRYLYMVIHTRSGRGIYARTPVGTYAYRPLVMQLPKQFYSPRYTVKYTQPDLRSTIHWEPNLITDAAGNAKLSFYAADKPGTYTVVIEGTDMQGHFGVRTQKITISQNTAGVKK